MRFLLTTIIDLSSRQQVGCLLNPLHRKGSRVTLIPRHVLNQVATVAVLFFLTGFILMMMMMMTALRKRKTLADAFAPNLSSNREMRISSLDYALICLSACFRIIEYIPCLLTYHFLKLFYYHLVLKHSC